ncbi:MAG: PAS domain S-box protein [Nitrospinae bacterium]|nr:PAS domain S-box protein [Nitrospinota bacterium]
MINLFPSLSPFLIVLVFAFIAYMWVVVVDVMSFPFVPIHILKDSTFVLFVTLLLYALIRQHEKALKVEQQEVEVLNRLYKIVINSNQMLIRSSTEQEMLQKTCEFIVKLGGYQMAWAFLLDDNGQIRISQCSSPSGECFTGFMGEMAKGCVSCPEAIAVSSGAPVICNSIISETRFPEWAVVSLKQGYKSVVCLPLRDNGNVLGAIALYSGAENVFNEKEMEILSELTGDLAFGVLTLKTRAGKMMAEESVMSVAKFPSENPNPVFRVNADGIVLYANTASGLMLGIWEGANRVALPEDYREAALSAYRARVNRELITEINDKSFSLVFVPFPEYAYINVYGRDITEYKQAIKTLKGESKYISSILDITAALIIAMDEKGRIITFNKACEKLTGYKSAELAGEKVWERLIPPEEISKAQMTMTALRETQKPSRYIGQWLTKDGDKRLISWSNTVVPATSERNAVIIGAGIDITEQAQAEKTTAYMLKLEKAIAEFSALFASGEEADIGKALEIIGRAVDANRSYIFSIRDGGSVMDNTHEWCKEGTEPQITNLRGIETSTLPWWMEKLNRGETIIIQDVESMPPEAMDEKKVLQAQDIKSLLVVPIAIRDGSLAGFLGFDDTEKTRMWSTEDARLLKVAAEIISGHLERQSVVERLKLLMVAVEQSSTAFVITDVDGKIVYGNCRVTEITGYNLEELIGQNPRILKSGHTTQSEYKRMWDTILTGRVWKGEFRNKKKNGELFWEAAIISPVRDSAGNISHFVAVKEDITKQKEAEEALLQSEKMASIGQLAAGVAHEINNPIGYVYSNIGSLERYVQDIFKVMDEYAGAEKALPKEELDRLEEVKRKARLEYVKSDIFDLMTESREGINRVKYIVQDLRDFSHTADTTWVLYDLHTGLNSTLNIVNNEIKYKAKVVKEYGDIPLVECMPMQLNQVFMNIIVNAAQAITENGLITIKTYMENEGVAVEIIDNGPGIPPEHLKRIFDPFFTTKPVGQGTGLGLSLAYSVVSKHDGHITVESEPDRGTRFKIWLPAVRKNNGT